MNLTEEKELMEVKRKKTLSEILGDCLAWGVIVVPVTIGLSFMLMFISPTFRNFVLDLKSGFTRNHNELSDGEIIAIAKNEVKNKLKSPSSAKFCPQYEIKIMRLDDTIMVTGTVEAQNSFGAMINNNFMVLMSPDGTYIEDVNVY